MSIDTTTNGAGENASQPSSGGEVANSPPALTGKRANWTIAHKVEVVDRDLGDGDMHKTTRITWSVKGAGTLELWLSALSEANRERAAAHGMVQRISDAAAMARDAKTGASATPQEKFEAMRRLVEHYGSGAEGWSPARAEGGVKVVKVNRDVELLVMALGIFNPQKDAGVIEKFVKGLKGAQVTALLVSEQLKESVELARQEFEEKDKAQAQGVDAEELLRGL